MTRDDLLARLTGQAQADERVLALLLGGSLGRGEGDAWSDLDLVGVVSPEDHPAFVEGARAWMERAAPLVLWRPPYPGIPLFNGITTEWLRVDLTVTVPGRVTGAQDGLKPLIDRAAVWPALSAALPPRALDPARLTGMVIEFIRVLGLSSVVLGRRELAVAVTGCGMLRTSLIALMIEELGLPQQPGALHLSRLLSPDDLASIESLPPLEATRASVIAHTLACAELFLPSARRLLERAGVAWPEVFEAATLAHLRRELGAEWRML